jgi:RNA polymerase sigma factor (sigma-70 family)
MNKNLLLTWVTGEPQNEAAQQSERVEQLFHDVYETLIKYCCKKFNLTFQEAEDDASEAILRFLERIERGPLEIESEDHFIRYLKKVACRVRFNKIEDRLLVTQCDDFSSQNLLAGNEISIDESIASKQIWAIAEKKLSNVQTKILHMYYRDGYSIEEIASTLDLSVRRVKYQKKTALITLRKATVKE